MHTKLATRVQNFCSRGSDAVLNPDESMKYHVTCTARSSAIAAAKNAAMY